MTHVAPSQSEVPYPQNDPDLNQVNSDGQRLYQSLIDDLSQLGSSNAMTAEEKQQHLDSVNADLHSHGFPTDLVITGLDESGRLLVDDRADLFPAYVESESAFTLNIQPVDQAFVSNGAGYRVNRDKDGGIESLDIINNFGATSSLRLVDGKYATFDAEGNMVPNQVAGRKIRPRSDGRVEIEMDTRVVHLLNPDGTEIAFRADERGHLVGPPYAFRRGNGDLYQLSYDENRDLIEHSILRANGEEETWVRVGEGKWQEKSSGRTFDVDVTVAADGTMIIRDIASGVTEYRVLEGSSIWTDASGKLAGVEYSRNSTLLFTLTPDEHFVGYTQEINGTKERWSLADYDPETIASGDNLFVLEDDS